MADELYRVKRCQALSQSTGQQCLRRGTVGEHGGVWCHQHAPSPKRDRTARIQSAKLALAEAVLKAARFGGQWGTTYDGGQIVPALDAYRAATGER